MTRSHDWRPEPVRSEEHVDPGRVRALAALLDSGAPVPGPGEDLPPLWHWVAMPQWPVSSELDRDGHPRRGRLLPPLELPRRMFAGGTVEVHRPLRVGEQVVREAVVESVETKRGRSGEFALVRVHHVLRGPDGTVRLEERQDLVFREAPTVTGPAADPGRAAGLVPVGPPLRPAGDGWDVATDPTLLMRFSAATANPHRIHYDWPYATRTEGYPGLVVHGPLGALLLAEALRLEEPGSRPHLLRHRNTAPLFCAEPARIRVTRSDGHRRATLRRGETALATLDTDTSTPAPEREP